MELELWLMTCDWQGADPRVTICARGATDDSDGCCGDSGGPMFGVDRYGNATCLYGVVGAGDPLCKKGSLFTRAAVLPEVNWGDDDDSKGQQTNYFL